MRKQAVLRAAALRLPTTAAVSRCKRLPSSGLTQMLFCGSQRHKFKPRRLQGVPGSCGNTAELWRYRYQFVPETSGSSRIKPCTEMHVRSTITTRARPFFLSSTEIHALCHMSFPV